MKKIIIFITLISALFAVNVNAETNEVEDKKVNVYIFRGDGCGYCKELVNYLNELEPGYEEYMNILLLETWNNSYNNSLKEEIAYKVGAGDTGVPFVVIGEEYIVGFNGDLTIQTAINEYNNDDYKDIVMPIINEEGNYDVESLEEAVEEEGLEYNGGFILEDSAFEVETSSSDDNKEKDTNIILIVSIVIITVAAVAGGMYFVIKKTKFSF